MDYPQKFLEYLQHHKRYSTHTLNSYRIDLQSFSEFLTEGFEIENFSEVNHHIIRAWLLQLMEQGKSRTSMKRKISTLRSFYKYLMRQELMEYNPAAQVAVPKPPQKLMRTLSQEEMQQLLDSEKFEGDFWDTTVPPTIIETFYQTGIRLDELINLKMINLNLTDGHIKVLGKRNKERVIPLSEKFCKKLKNYISECREWRGMHSNDYLFATRKGKKLYPKIVYNTINYYLSKVSGVEKKSPHVLRHTFATHLLNQGADLNSIKELLGHSSLAATQVYTHNSIDKLKNMYNQAHPRSPKNQ